MTMHHYISEPRKQKLRHHCLVGYDPASERAVYSVRIPKSKIDLLRRFVRFEPDDPEGYDCYKVEHSNVVKLLDFARSGIETAEKIGILRRAVGRKNMNTWCANCSISALSLRIRF